MALSQDILWRTLSLIPVVLSLSVHEWAHAWTAAQLGDTTAKDQGRLTLNPLAHVDVVGTIALPLLGVPFGWARPVPVEPTRFRRDVSMTWGMLLTAAAGPLSNLLLAAVCSLLLVLGRHLHAPLGLGGVAELLLSRSVVINAVLCVFNLLPIAPLDGGRIVDGLVPFEYRDAWRRTGLVLTVLLSLLLFVIGSGWVARVTHDLLAPLVR